MIWYECVLWVDVVYARFKRNNGGYEKCCEMKV